MKDVLNLVSHPAQQPFSALVDKIPFSRQKRKPGNVSKKMSQRTRGSPPARKKQQWSVDRNIKAADHTNRAVSQVRTRTPVSRGDREDNALTVASTADKNQSRNLPWSLQSTDNRPNLLPSAVVDRLHLLFMQNRFGAESRCRISKKIEVAPWKVAKSAFADSTDPVSGTLSSSGPAFKDGAGNATGTTTASSISITEELPLPLLNPMNNENLCAASARGDGDGCTEADSSMFDAALPAHSIIDLSTSAASPAEEFTFSGADGLGFGDMTMFSQAVSSHNTRRGGADIQECMRDPGSVDVGCKSEAASGTSNSRKSAVAVRGAEVTGSIPCNDGKAENFSADPSGGFNNVYTPQMVSRGSDGPPDGGRGSFKSMTSTRENTSASPVTSSQAAEDDTTETESGTCDAEDLVATDQDAATADDVARPGSLRSHLDDATDSVVPSDRASEPVAAAATSMSSRTLKVNLGNDVDADGRMEMVKSTPVFDGVGSGSNPEVVYGSPLFGSVDLDSSIPSTSNAEDNAAAAEVEHIRAIQRSSASPARQVRLSPRLSSVKNGVASSLDRSDSRPTRAVTVTGRWRTFTVRMVPRSPEFRAIISPKRALLKRTFESMGSRSSCTSADGAAITCRSTSRDIVSTSAGGGSRPKANGAGLRESVHPQQNRTQLAPSSLPCLSHMPLAAASAPHAQTPIESSGAPAAVFADNNARDLPARLSDSKAMQLAENGDVRSSAAGSMNILEHIAFFGDQAILAADVRMKGRSPVPVSCSAAAVGKLTADCVNTDTGGQASCAVSDKPSISPRQPGDNKGLISEDVANQTALNKLQVSLARCKAELVVKQRVVEKATTSREALWITYTTLLDSFNHVAEESTKLRTALATEREARATQGRMLESSTGAYDELRQALSDARTTAAVDRARLVSMSGRVQELRVSNQTYARRHAAMQAALTRKAVLRENYRREVSKVHESSTSARELSSLPTDFQATYFAR